jgi:hypothetical protein
VSFDFSRALPFLAPAFSPDDTAPLRVYGSQDGPVTRELSPSLVVQYTLDDPGALVFIRERDVPEAARDTLHLRAIENLRGRLARRRLRFEPHGPICYAKLDGEHEASLLLLDELWDPPTRVTEPDGELVVAAPARDVLAFAGSSAVRDLRKLAERSSLSPEVLVRRQRSWVTLETPI